MVHLPKIKKNLWKLEIDFVYKNELNKACFQHDMAYGRSKDLIKRIQSDKVLKIKHFKLLIIQITMVIKED